MVSSDPPDIRFRPLTRADFTQLRRWLATPEVRRWWNHDVTPEAVERDFGAGVDGTEPGETLIVECDSQAIGLLLRYRLVDYAEYAIELAAVIDPGRSPIVGPL